MENFYNLSILDDKKDINGNKPRLYMICGNRTGGKTSAVMQKSIEDYLEHDALTVCLYRDVSELETAHVPYQDVIDRLYPDAEVSSKVKANGLYAEITWIDGKHDGIIAVAISIKKRDKIKKLRALFRRLRTVIFDEFLLEDDDYIKNEIDCFTSVYLTLISGGGHQYRKDIVFYLISNKVSAINPYFLRFGITKRLQSNTIFMRGDEWLLHIYISESAHQSIMSDGLLAQLSTDMQEYSAGDKVLIDKNAFITKAKGKNRLLYNIKHNGKIYAVREYKDYWYIDSNNITQSDTLVFNHADFDVGTYWIKRTSHMYKHLNDLYAMGFVRFSDAYSKDMFIDLMSLKFF